MAEISVIDRLFGSSSTARANHNRTIVTWEDVIATTMPNIMLGFALITSSFVQAALFGLTAYHALVVLNLSWIIGFSTSYAYFVNVAMSRGGQPFRLLIVCHIVHLSFMGLFGQWVISHNSWRWPLELDEGCASSTVFDLFGHDIFFVNSRFQHFWGCTYWIVILPLINTAFVSLICMVVLFFTIIPNIFAYTITGRWSPRTVDAVVSFAPGVIPLTIIIFLNEKMIASNTVVQGENVWSFGQVSALFIALPPVARVVVQIVQTCHRAYYVSHFPSMPIFLPLIYLSC
jgi:hypothetical protein